MARATRFKALPPWASRVRWFVIGCGVALPMALQLGIEFLFVIALPLMAAVGVVLALQALLPQTVEVGTDGVMLRSAAMRRFLPFEQIRDVRMTPLGLALSLTSGKRHEIRLSHEAGVALSDIERLYSSIDDARKAFAQLVRPQEEALLAQGSRDASTWAEQMLTVGTQAATYRAHAIPKERLWEILENAAAARSAREGAALALRATLDDDGRARFRAIGDATASPRLRALLHELDSADASVPPTRIRVALETLDVDEPQDETDAVRTKNSSP